MRNSINPCTCALKEYDEGIKKKFKIIDSELAGIKRQLAALEKVNMEQSQEIQTLEVDYRLAQTVPDEATAEVLDEEENDRKTRSWCLTASCQECVAKTKIDGAFRPHIMEQ